MNRHERETDARIAIDELLRQSGWDPADKFVARVEGRSMEPTIPDGSYCLFRAERGGTREGKLGLVWHRGCTDPALGGEFSVALLHEKR